MDRPTPSRAHTCPPPLLTPPHDNSSFWDLKSTARCLFNTPPTVPRHALNTPPPSPPSSFPHAHVNALYKNVSLDHDVEVHCIDAATLDATLRQLAQQPLPPSATVFPWLHGLRPESDLHRELFYGSASALHPTPPDLRGVIIVKVGGDLSSSKLLGAVSPHEILQYQDGSARFVTTEARDRLGIRNFDIQLAKMIPLSDIVVYGESYDDVIAFAKAVSQIQRSYPASNSRPPSTFVLTDPFSLIETDFPHLVAKDDDFSLMERREMRKMSATSQISRNVWVGVSNTPGFDIELEAVEAADWPSNSEMLLAAHDHTESSVPLRFEIPASGSLAIPTDVDRHPLLKLCRWIHRLAHGQKGDHCKRVLLHCTDGYTETTLVMLAYYMFAEKRPLHEAILSLHRNCKRDFFAYPTDIAVLKALELRLVQRRTSSPAWMEKLDGSLPSRITPYMYLGNVGHANNAALLEALGIGQVLSIGEPISWELETLRGWKERHGVDSILHISGIFDNGADPLLPFVQRCLDFIRGFHHLFMP